MTYDMYGEPCIPVYFSKAELEFIQKLHNNWMLPGGPNFYPDNRTFVGTKVVEALREIDR